MWLLVSARKEYRAGSDARMAGNSDCWVGATVREDVLGTLVFFRRPEELKEETTWVSFTSGRGKCKGKNPDVKGSFTFLPLIPSDSDGHPALISLM